MTISDDDWSNYLINVKGLSLKKISNIPIVKKVIINKQIRNKSNLIKLSSYTINKFNDKLGRNFIIDDRLDLHGFTKDLAKNTLLNFIIKSFNNKNRNLLVITGKGLTSNGTNGVLRNNLPIWLNENPITSMIGSFCYAKHKDGGNGAFYLRLKKLNEAN